MYYAYVLRSGRDGRWYTGMTADLRERVRAHDRGKVLSTRYRRPLELVYYEACRSESDAKRRELYLKTGRGKKYLRQRLLSWIRENSFNKLERHKETKP